MTSSSSGTTTRVNINSNTGAVTNIDNNTNTNPTHTPGGPTQTGTAISDSGHLIFGLYPSHRPNLFLPSQLQQGAAGTPPRYPPSGDTRNDKQIFYEQPAGNFVDFNREAQLRQQRIVAHSQLQQLRENIPVWSPDDDAKTFAPFFLAAVYALTHIRRMITGVAAGASFLILIAIYWASSLGGVAVDANTRVAILNSTIGGAYGALCLNETLADCSSVVAYASVFKPASYFFLLASMLTTFLSLVPFTFDLALLKTRSPLTNMMTNQNNMNAQSTTGTSNNANNNNANNTMATAAAAGSAAHDGTGGGGNNNPSPLAQIAQTTTTVQTVGPPVMNPVIYMVVRHLVFSTFPLFFIALCATMAMARVEVDRRALGRMVSITDSQLSTIRAGLILRSTCFILAWMCSFRLKEPTPSEEVLNAEAVIDVRR